MNKNKLTKANFIQFLNCPKSLWLLKNKPNEYPIGEFSLFLERCADVFLSWRGLRV
jgi:hypothetical protein